MISAQTWFMFFGVMSFGVLCFYILFNIISFYINAKEVYQWYRKYGDYGRYNLVDEMGTLKMRISGIEAELKNRGK